MKYVFEIINNTGKLSDSYGIIILSDGDVRKYSLDKPSVGFCKVANSTHLFTLTDEQMVKLNKGGSNIALLPLKVFETNHSVQSVKYYYRKESSDSMGGSHHIGTLGSVVEFNPSSIGLIVELTNILGLAGVNGYELLKNIEPTYLNYYSPRSSDGLKESFGLTESTKSFRPVIPTVPYCVII